MNRARLLVYATALSAIVGGGLIAPQPAQAQLGLGSLIVTITSPADVSPVSGTVPVNASVSIIGSLTVSQVQFYRDGNLIGSDSASPYSVSWNTTSTNNGSHTLTAVATDILGVRWNSNPVSVTVSNGPPPDTTPPMVPTGLTDSAVSSSQINLSWTASSDNVGVSGYRVYRNGTQIATTSATSFADTGLAASTTYSYTVAAYDAAGNLSAQSSPASATTPAPPDTTPPSVPTGLTASAVSSSQINLSWTASSDNVGVSGYRVYRNGTQIATTGATSFANTGLSPSTTYSYTVAAYDAAGNLSAQSSPASATTPAPPDTTPPAVTINQAAGQADPTNSSPINFTAVFSEPVSGFSGAGVTISGTAGGTKTVTVTGGPSTYTVAVSGMSTDGTVIASIPAGVAQDAAGNLNTASTSTDNSVSFDATRPAATINQAAGQADPTNSSPINFTAVFSGPVSGFTGAGVTISGTAGGTKTVTVTGGPSTYTVAVSGMSTDGTVIASIPAGVAQDAAGNLNTASTSTDNSVSFDATRPAATINQAAGQADPTNSSPINFTAVFSGPVSGFTGAGVTISGTASGTKTVTVSGGPSTYTVAVSGMSTDGTVIASIPAGVAQDAAGNLNTASTSTDNSVSFDATRPAATINQAAGQADPTNSSPINFTAVFSGPVSGFTGAGVTISGTASGTKTVTVSGGPSTYTVAVSGMTTDGTVIASIPAGVAQDAAGNLNTASTSTDNSVSFDATRPAATINQAAGQADPTNSSPINFTAVFSGPVSGFTGAGVTISGTASGTKTVTVSGGPSTYTVAVSGMTTDGTVIASIPAGVAQDAAGNLNTAPTSTDNSVSFDATRPAVTINQAAGQADPTNSSPINFSAVFSGPVSGFTGAGVTISGTASGTKTVTVSGGPSTYTVAVSGMTTDGTVIASIPAGVAQDAAGNLNTASTSTDNSVSFDATRPAVTINQAAGQADPTNSSPINFTAVFSGPVSGFTGAGVTISGTAGGTKTVTVSGGPSTYNVAVSGMSSAGTVLASIPAGVARDAAGNLNTASTSTDNSVTF